MFYNFTKKQKYHHIKNARVKSKIVTFLIVNVKLNLTQFIDFLGFDVPRNHFKLP